MMEKPGVNKVFFSYLFPSGFLQTVAPLPALRVPRTPLVRFVRRSSRSRWHVC